MYQFDFSGGNVCLDFVNTLGDRPRCQEEQLASWRDVVNWASQAGIVSKRAAASLQAATEARGDCFVMSIESVLWQLRHSSESLALKRAHSCNASSSR